MKSLDTWDDLNALFDMLGWTQFANSTMGAMRG